MKHLFSTLLAGLSLLAPPVLAQDNPVVVELFTSQGCSSCPPADAIFRELAGREDVIALALHVDYWDYIGWKDPFGHPDHAERQKAYAAAGQRRSIYTPEMVVNGTTDIVGAKPMKLSEAIAEHARQPVAVSLDLLREGDKLRISASAAGAIAGPVTVYLLRYTPESETKIKRGENAGHTYSYTNIVEGLTELGSWDAVAPLEMQTSVSGLKPVVVLLQQHNSGPILAAARWVN